MEVIRAYLQHQLCSALLLIYFPIPVMDIDAWTAQLLRKPRTGSDITQSRQELEQLLHIHMDMD